MKRRKLREELAKVLYGQKDWELISSVTKDYWREKAERSIDFLILAIAANGGWMNE